MQRCRAQKRKEGKGKERAHLGEMHPRGELVSAMTSYLCDGVLPLSLVLPFDAARTEVPITFFDLIASEQAGACKIN